MDIVVKNAKVVTAAEIFDADIGIENGKIKAYSHDMQPNNAEVIDVGGKIVLPGAIDAHTHMSFPFMGTTSADDFWSGTVSAACGGTTSIIDFVLPKPSQTMSSALDEYRRKADPDVAVDYGLHMIFKSHNEPEASSVAQIVNQGVSSFKLFMTYRKEGLMLDDSGIFKVMKAVGAANGLVAVHAENNGIIENLVQENLSASNKGAKYHALSKPDLAEGEAVSRAAYLARQAGAKCYIVHLSSDAGRMALETAQASGCNIFAETCPHYLILTADLYERPDGRNFVMSPPLRSKKDCESLWEGIRRGSIQTIGSDHCPFTSEQKNMGRDDFTKIPNGVPGTETIVPLMFSEGFKKGRISIFDMVRVTSFNPARHFGIYPSKGTLAVGSDADLVVVDPSKRVRLTADVLHTKIDYSIYDNITTEGYPVLTMSRGEVVMRDGEFLGSKGRGRFLSRTPARSHADD
ncbi:MAG: dihydropyrimidinase [Thermoprotei archaeon]